MLEDFTYGTFAGHVGEKFMLQVSTSQDVELELIRASEKGGESTSAGGDGAPARQGERFSLVFRGPRENPLPQHTYEFRHAELGSFPLFIVPIGMDADGYLYEAVFTRLPSGVSTP